MSDGCWKTEDEHTYTLGNFVCDDCGFEDNDAMFAEVETLRAKVARVEALADEWERDRDVCLAWIASPDVHVDDGHALRLSHTADSLNNSAGALRRALEVTP